VGVQGFLIDPGMVNNYKLKNVLLTYFYAHPNTLVGYFHDTILLYPGITITQFNAYFGLQYFASTNNKIEYEINWVIN